jgi:hypothetical protein
MNTLEKPKCFVIMPFTSPAGYDKEHFSRVYEYLLKPACTEAGFEPSRADETAQTNHIMLDVLRKTVESEMVLCDLSGRNPNVLYELGIRQAFNKPVTLVKDRQTSRVFDVDGLRTLEYDSSLRIDVAALDKARIVESLKGTAAPKTGDVNSLVDLLGVAPAKIAQPVELSERDTLLLNALRDIGQRLTSLEDRQRHGVSWPSLVSPSLANLINLPDYVVRPNYLDVIVNKHGEAVVAQAIEEAAEAGRRARDGTGVSEPTAKKPRVGRKKAPR